MHAASTAFPHAPHARDCAPPAAQTDHAEHPDAKVVTLRGAPDCVAMAKVEISKLLDEALNPADGENEERITCPAGIVGRIIGRGGETIR